MIRSLFFYLFSLIDTIITSINILLVSLFLRDSLKRKKFIYYYLTRYWGRRLVYYTGSKIEIVGKKKIDFDQNYLILVNHQSNFDIYILIGFLNLPLCFLSKIQNFKIPLIGSVMYRMGCIAINRSNHREALKSIYQTAQRYREGMSIVIYPEGTRSSQGKILPFKPGFIHIIEKIDQDCHLLPVSLSGTRKIQEKRKLKIQSRKVKIVISPPVIVDAKRLKKDNQFKKNLVLQLEKTIRDYYQADL